MDKNRIKGSAKQAKGAIKQAVGKVTGDSKLQAEGKADKTAGKVQNAIGGVKDALRGKIGNRGASSLVPSLTVSDLPWTASMIVLRMMRIAHGGKVARRKQPA